MIRIVLAIPFMLLAVIIAVAIIPLIIALTIVCALIWAIWSLVTIIRGK